MLASQYRLKSAASLARDYEIVAEWLMEARGYQLPGKKTSARQRSMRALERLFLPHYFGSPPRWRLLARRIGGQRILPDFCLIGPLKAATSDLAVSLLLHPNVIPPLSKEFWERDPEAWRIYYPTEKEKRRHEARCGPSLAPYLTPSLHLVEVPYHLARIRPHAKVVITLRDPVARLFSHWKWEKFLAGKRVADRLPFLATFAAYVDKSLALFPSLPMFTACELPGLAASIYWKAVQGWIECFGPDAVLVLDVGDYFADRNRFMRVIQDFVGLPRVDIPLVARKTNENPLRFPPPDEATVSKLKQFFQPHNQMLWRVIGKEFPW